jgi:hypothetical protein
MKIYPLIYMIVDSLKFKKLARFESKPFGRVWLHDRIDAF